MKRFELRSARRWLFDPLPPKADVLAQSYDFCFAPISEVVGGCSTIGPSPLGAKVTIDETAQTLSAAWVIARFQSD